ncbi:MAG: ATP-binding cassette domain-containing protein [Actinomycetaceae bacterium]|nr:ATP-binding cassette domain-containing protein [Actinomycetaceae bacterium]
MTTEAKNKIVLEARNLVKKYGHVTAINGADFELRAGEVLAVIGDNGAGKSTLIKVLSGAIQADSGEVFMDGQAVHFRNTLDARAHGIETVYQDLAVIPALDIASNVFLGRELRRRDFFGRFFRRLDQKEMQRQASHHLAELKIGIGSVKQSVETLSGGQRQGVAVVRAAAFGKRVIIMDEPTAALGVKESSMVIDLIRKIRDKGLPVILISHNMPNVFEVADRIHVHRLGKRAAVVRPTDRSMSEVVALMTGAETPTPSEASGGY